MHSARGACPADPTRPHGRGRRQVRTTSDLCRRLDAVSSFDAKGCAMTTIEASAEPLVPTAANLVELQARLDHETIVLIALAERIGRDPLKASDLTEYARALQG